MKFFLNIFILLFCCAKFSLAADSEMTCYEFKKFIEANEQLFFESPNKDEVNYYGIYLKGNYNENNVFIYDQVKKGIEITHVVSKTTREEFKLSPYDIITKIDNIKLEDLFKNNSEEEASKKIDTLLFKNNIEIESYDYDFDTDEYLKKQPIKIFHHIYNAPTEVWIDFNVADMIFIDIKKNTYTAKYDYYIEWKDNRFKEYLSDVDFNRCDFKYINQSDELYKSFWIPEIIEENKIENIDTFDEFKYANIVFYIWEDDVFIQLHKYNTAKFNILFELNDFPFDNQTFPFQLYTPDTHHDIILLPTYDQNYSEANKNYFLDTVKHPEWQYKSIDSEIYPLAYTDDSFYDKFEYSIKAEREYIYYIYKVIIPVILILMICWSVFWINGMQLESRLTVTSVSFLALIAYNYVVDEDLPRMGYSTTLDYIILVAYIFAGLATILTIYSYLDCRKKDKDFSSIDIYARFIGPIAYIVTNIYLVYSGIQSMTLAQFFG